MSTIESETVQHDLFLPEVRAVLEHPGTGKISPRLRQVMDTLIANPYTPLPAGKIASYLGPHMSQRTRGIKKLFAELDEHAPDIAPLFHREGYSNQVTYWFGKTQEGNPDGDEVDPMTSARAWAANRSKISFYDLPQLKKINPFYDNEAACRVPYDPKNPTNSQAQLEKFMDNKGSVAQDEVVATYCFQCPVAAACLRYSLDLPDMEAGIYGGVATKKRRELQKINRSQGEIAAMHAGFDMWRDRAARLKVPVLALGIEAPPQT